MELTLFHIIFPIFKLNMGNILHNIVLDLNNVMWMNKLSLKFCGPVLHEEESMYLQGQP